MQIKENVFHDSMVCWPVNLLEGHTGNMVREGDGTPLQYSCLENPMDGGAWSQRVGHDFTFTFTFHFHALEKEMATHSSVFAWRIPGTGEPGGLPSIGSQRVGHDWSDLAAAAAGNIIKLCYADLSFSNAEMKWFLSDLEYSFKIKRHGAFVPMEYPSPLKVLVTQSCPTLCNPMECSLPGSSVHVDSPGKNTGMGCHSILQGIFLTQGLNLALPHCRQILYRLSHEGSPWNILHL